MKPPPRHPDKSGLNSNPVKYLFLNLRINSIIGNHIIIQTLDFMKLMIITLQYHRFHGIVVTTHKH